MNSTKLIHIHVEGSPASHSRPVDEAKNVGALIELLIAAGIFASAKSEDIFIFEEDAAEELPRDFRFGPEHHGKQFHAHRCKKIAVTFINVDEEKEHSFRPGATIAKLLEWAKKNFPIEAGKKYELRLSAKGEPLPLADHVGSYVRHGDCSLKVYFTPSSKVQG